MNKDFIVVLLRKDIQELQLLTEGFEQMSVFPAPILRLASQKAESIVNSLKSLASNFREESLPIDEDSFGTIASPENYYEKNNFDAPLDSDIEELHEEMMGMQEREECHINTKYQLDHVAESAEKRTEKEAIVCTDVNFESAKVEEFQEEVEVEELSENEEVISYPIRNITANYVSQVGIKEEIKEEPKSADIETSASFTETSKEEDTKENQTTAGVSVLDKIQEQRTNSLSDNIANQKIDDIRQAMNIGDRFRFQRELFGGNGEVMNKTISYLNQLAKYEEAESFLISKFGWSDDNPHVDEFLQLIKKRY